VGEEKEEIRETKKVRVVKKKVRLIRLDKIGSIRIKSVDLLARNNTYD
jgi:hypothetical protein